MPPIELCYPTCMSIKGESLCSIVIEDGVSVDVTSQEDYGDLTESSEDTSR